MESFQSLSVKQGAIGEDLAAIRVVDAGFEINGIKVSLPGVEVDIVATNKHDISFYLSVKASWRGDRQGLKRTDTLAKAIAEALMINLNGLSPVLFITSHNPKGGRGAERMKLLPRDIVFDSIELHNDSSRLNWLASATERDLEKDLIEYPCLWDMIRKR
jgi:hypothetical protein